MSELQRILDQLRDTDSTAAHFERLMEEQPRDATHASNMRAIQKRRADLERRLWDELSVTQTDLVQYHVERPSDDRYPVLAVAKAIAGFQELVTAVFDAIRTTPKQRYRPTAESIALSTLDFAMALPVGSVVVSLSVSDERLLAVKSDLERTFDGVFALLRSAHPEDLKEVATALGIASIAKAHDWAESSAEYGLNTRISIKKDQNTEVSFNITGDEAQRLKETIEEKSDQNFESETIIGELLGIDVARPNTYFHLKTQANENIEGKLADTFPVEREWAVHNDYKATLIKVTTIRYSTGEEKVSWILAGLIQIQTD
jgi:hypothetical protein